MTCSKFTKSIENGKLIHVSKNSKISKRSALVILNVPGKLKGAYWANFFLSSQISFQKWNPIFPMFEKKMFLCYSYWQCKYIAVLLCKNRLFCPLYNIFDISWRTWQQVSPSSCHSGQGTWRIMQLIVFRCELDTISGQLSNTLCYMSAGTIGKG